ncbi:cadherin domain-containing protein [Microvirga terricola]|uniref:Cadherin domain-containing protein n=1 Tax=Microvirga terricola TaxID=2719797 RepID=A0ABX0VCF7_9HYPH|nr:cadherin domain-containing protein [Microvirga terricola]NIX76640.1 hypothetical protein [Microvirga terricola]
MASPIVKIGDETRVNVTTAGDQIAPRIKALADGGWVVVWQSANQDGAGWGIYQQRYDQEGKAVGTVDQLVNVTTPNDQWQPSIAALSDGGWVVTWSSGFSWDGEIYQRRYDKNGNPVGGETRVNTTTTYDQSASNVTALSDGGWVVTWQSYKQDGSDNGIYQQRYDASGNVAGGERLVNTLTDGNQYRASVTALTDGGWVVTWESHNSSFNTHHIFQQRFDKFGTATSPTADITVEGNTMDYKIISSVTGLADGGWVVTWTSYNDGDIHQQRFDKNGSALLATSARVNVSSTGAQEPSTVTALADGGWIVVWESPSHDGSGDGIYFQQFDKDGKAVFATDQLVNVTTAGDQQNPSVTALPGGGWVITWQSANQDGSGYGIYHRYYLTDTNRAPTDITLSRDTVDEGTTGLIATLTGVDPDADEIFTYALAEDLSGKFEIVGRELRLKDGAILDYETTKSYAIKITVTDHGGRSYTKTVTIQVTDVNEKPTSLKLSTTEVDEDASGKIATLSATDPDAGETFIYTLVADPSGKFEIVGNELRLKAGATLDYGSAKSHLVTIQVTDHGGLTYTKTFSIDVNYVAGKNHAPTHVTLNGGAAASINENSDHHAFIGILDATDLDGDALTYSFAPGGDAGGLFVIDNTTKEIKLAPGAVIDYEALPAGAKYYTLWVIASDGRGGVTAPQKIVIGVNDMNEAPEMTLAGTGAGGSLIVNENADNGTIVGTLDAVDPEGDAVTYTLLDNAGGRFKIVGNKIVVANGNLLDFEAINGMSHEITVLVKDSKGAYQVKTFTVDVKDVNESPTGLALSRIEVARDTTGLIASLTGQDPDAGETFTFALAEDASGKFEVIGNELRLKGGQSLDAGVTSYTVKVTVTDHGGLSVTKAVTFTVKDAVSTPDNHAPTNVTLNGGTAASINENSDHHAFIGILDATDLDGDALTYSFAPGGDAGGLFVIDNTTKEIKLAPGAVIDYEALPAGAKYYTLWVIASDGRGGKSAPQEITIGVNDVNEAPEMTLTGTGAGGALVVNENAENGTLIGTLAAIDPEGDAVSYTLLDNAGGRFKIVGNKIVVANGALIDFETINGTAHEITVLVKDAKGAYQVKTFAIDVKDVNEKPTDVRLSTTAVDEDATGDLATLSGTDPDAGDTFTYALAFDPSGNFEIVDNKLRLKDGQSLDYETAKSHTIKITVTDHAGLSVTKTVAIDINDVNEKPTGLALSRTEVMRDTTGLIASLTGQDPDAHDAFTFALAEDASGKFEVIGNELRLKGGQSLDAGVTSYTVKVTVTDHGGLSVTKAVTFAVKDVVGTPGNHAPTNVTLNGATTISLDENADHNTFIGTLNAFDLDGDDVTYSFAAGGNAGGLFVIDNETNQIKLAPGAVIDYEAMAEGAKFYTLKVVASDGKGGVSAPQTITIVIKDVNEAPAMKLAGTGTGGALQVDEHATIETLVGNLSAVDPEGDAVSYVLINNAEGRFKIVGSALTGYKIVVANGSLLDYATGGSHDIAIMAVDAKGAIQVQTFTITVNDVNEPPTNRPPSDIALSGASVSELAGAGTPVGDLSATDDPGSTFTFKLLNDADGRFMLDATGTKIVANKGVKLDYEQAKTHAIQIEVKDQGGATFTKWFTISVGDVSSEGTAGSAESDKIVGGAGKDSIGGGAGDDTLFGGLGNDTLTGGIGKDVFVFDTKPNKKTNFDTITDFNVKDDSIYLDDAVFKKLGKGAILKPGKLNKNFFTVGDKAKDKDDYLIYNSKTGILSYDADGSGAGKAVEIAQLKKGFKMTYADFFVI